MRSGVLAAALIVFGVLSSPVPPVRAQDTGGSPQAAAKEHATALKANLAASKTILRGYEWTETTTIDFKGNPKPGPVNRCSYAADGSITKTPVGAPPAEEKKKGLRGKIVENKKEEIGGAIKAASALMKSYLPPDPAKIEAARAAGKISFQPAADQSAWLTITDYNKPGDKVAFQLDLANNLPRQAKIDSYLDKKDETVSMNVTFASVANATYAAKTVLAIPGNDLTVTVANSDYKPKAK